jgi:hypothetical protein
VRLRPRAASRSGQIELRADRAADLAMRSGRCWATEATARERETAWTRYSPRFGVGTSSSLKRQVHAGATWTGNSLRAAVRLPRSATAALLRHAVRHPLHWAETSLTRARQRKW